jgi:transposase
MNVVWSDEFMVERFRDFRQIEVFREPDGRWVADCIYPKPKDFVISLMVLGFFYGANKGLLILVPEDITGIHYQKIIRHYLRAVLRSLLKSYPYVTFQHDNAPVHTAKISTE